MHGDERRLTSTCRPSIHPEVGSRVASSSVTASKWRLRASSACARPSRATGSEGSVMCACRGTGGRLCKDLLAHELLRLPTSA